MYKGSKTHTLKDIKGGFQAQIPFITRRTSIREGGQGMGV